VEESERGSWSTAALGPQVSHAKFNTNLFPNTSNHKLDQNHKNYQIICLCPLQNSLAEKPPLNETAKNQTNKKKVRQNFSRKWRKAKEKPIISRKLCNEGRIIRTSRKLTFSTSIFLLSINPFDYLIDFDVVLVNAFFALLFYKKFLFDSIIY
jgi:hypothetical protein